MVDFRYKYRGLQGCLSVKDPDANQRLRDYWGIANPIYIIDELIIMLFPGREKILSLNMPTGYNKTPENLAALNELSEIAISFEGDGFKKII
ncbi:hypothetical protein [Vibrio sp. HN007]|uniref:hypothetical protein n=1 Tax=Vibrio iocasae TaxID=3098914 RepID=UPI0035D4B6B6